MLIQKMVVVDQLHVLVVSLVDRGGTLFQTLAHFPAALVITFVLSAAKTNFKTVSFAG